MAGLAVAALGGFALGYGLLSPGAPFGKRLSPVKPLLEYKRVTIENTSLLAGRVHDAWLPNLAPQDDGAPPLLWGFTSERADFSIRLPYGAETTTYRDEEFSTDAVEMQAIVRLDQPLRAVKISLPGRRAGETIEVYASRVRSELTQQQAVFYAEQDPVDLPAYRFVRLEYHRVHDGADIAHCVFAGPLGNRVLMIDMMCEPKHRLRCRPYFEKIIRSFSPGWLCKRAMLKEDPAYGEYAGSGLLQDDSTEADS